MQSNISANNHDLQFAITQDFSTPPLVHPVSMQFLSQSNNSSIISLSDEIHQVDYGYTETPKRRKQEYNGPVNAEIINSLFSPAHIENRLDYYIHTPQKPKQRLGSIGFASCIHYSYRDWNRIPMYSRSTQSILCTNAEEQQDFKSNYIDYNKNGSTYEFKTPSNFNSPSIYSINSMSTGSTYVLSRHSNGNSSGSAFNNHFSNQRVVSEKLQFTTVPLSERFQDYDKTHGIRPQEQHLNSKTNSVLSIPTTYLSNQIENSTNENKTIEDIKDLPLRSYVDKRIITSTGGCIYTVLHDSVQMKRSKSSYNNSQNMSQHSICLPHQNILSGESNPIFNRIDNDSIWEQHYQMNYKQLS